MGRTSKKAEFDLVATVKRWRDQNTDDRKPTIQDVAELAGVSKDGIANNQ